MAFPYAIGEYEAISLNSGGTFVTTAGAFDSDACRGAMNLTNVQFFRRDLDGTHNEVWVHGALNPTDTGGQADDRICSVTTTDPNDVVAELSGNNGDIELLYYNGGGITTVATGVPLVPNTANILDLHVLLDNSVGVFAVYLNGTLLHETTPGDTLFDRQCSIVSYNSVSSSGASRWSECIINDTTTTIGRRLLTLGIDANGSNTAWTGDFTDIDEVGAVDDADFISTTAASNIETFTFPNLSATFAGFEVDAVVLSATGTADGGGAPQNIRHYIDSSASVATGANFAALTPSFTTGHQTVFAVDPNGGGAWDIANIDGINIGVESQT